MTAEATVSTWTGSRATDVAQMRRDLADTKAATEKLMATRHATPHVQASQRAMPAGADAAARWDTQAPVGAAAGVSVRGSALAPAAPRAGDRNPPTGTSPTNR